VNRITVDAYTPYDTFNGIFVNVIPNKTVNIIVNIIAIIEGINFVNPFDNLMKTLSIQLQIIDNNK